MTSRARLDVARLDRAKPEATMDDVDAGPVPMGAINPRDYRFVMSLARRYNAIVFWHRDRNGVDWQPLLLPLGPRKKTTPPRAEKESA